MRKKKTVDKEAAQLQAGTDYDPFLRRIQLQGTVLKKILAEVDLQAKHEDNKEPKKLHKSKTLKIHKQSNT